MQEVTVGSRWAFGGVSRTTFIVTARDGELCTLMSERSGASVTLEVEFVPLHCTPLPRLPVVPVVF